MLMLNFYNDIYGNNDDIDVNENCNRCRENTYACYLNLNTPSWRSRVIV